jgi:hypothetical protein
MTKTEKIVNELIKRGCTEVIPSKSSKYRQFKISHREEFYWVGRSGALRVGKNSSHSMSININYGG